MTVRILHLVARKLKGSLGVHGDGIEYGVEGSLLHELDDIVRDDYWVPGFQA